MLTLQLFSFDLPPSFEPLRCRDLRKTKSYRDVIYRLDKCDSYNSSASNFANLARLLEDTEIRSECSLVLLYL